MGRKSQSANSSIVCMASMLMLFSGCHKKFPADSALLNVPETEQVGTIYARENLLRALMASHEQQWADSAQYFENVYQSDRHPTIVQLHEQVQQASKSVNDSPEDH